MTSVYIKYEPIVHHGSQISILVNNLYVTSIIAYVFLG